MATEIEKSKQKPETITFRRGPETVQRLSGGSLIDVHDNGARVSLSKTEEFAEFNLIINFGYTSDQYKDYSRTMSINLEQTFELIKFLQERIYESAKINGSI